MAWGQLLDGVRLLLCAAGCFSSLAASLHGWATARRDGRHGGAPTRVQQRFRTRSEDAGGAWELWDRPTWEAAAKWRSVAPGASERVAAACLVVERPSAASAASATSFTACKTYLASAPSTVATQARHGGRKGRLTAVTHVFYNTCVTV